MHYHEASVKWLEPALILPQLQEKENSQKAAILTANNLAISSLIADGLLCFLLVRQCLMQYP
jgi:hypothetical protein